MKRKRKTALSATQQKKLLRITVGIIVVTVLWVVFAPGRGIFFLRQQKKHLAELKVEQKRLSLENNQMEQDIKQLQSSKEYLEQVAREEHGMVKDNEIVFDFAKERKKKE
ncbi:MAG TPA: septum formation initiator family protein [Desulfocapsa sulfexigens]|nr:septum formation initiator family protein [Desulfocapsa sulfexigens]